MFKIDKKALVSTFILMESVMRVTTLMVNSMVWASTFSPMENAMKANTCKVNRMDKVYTFT
jgi:hypothetical protein